MLVIRVTPAAALGAGRGGGVPPRAPPHRRAAAARAAARPGDAASLATPHSGYHYDGTGRRCE